LADGRYIDINKNFEKVLGWSRDEVIGHTSQELDIFVDYSKRDDMADLLKRDGRICNYEANIKTKSGEVKIGEFSAEFVEVGGQKCLLAHVTDITERKRMEEAIKERENKYRRLFENSPMGIISVDIDGRITEVNERLVEVMDIHSVQATKQTNVLEFPPLIEAGFSDCFRRCLESGVSMSYEHPYVSKWNKPLHLRLKLNPICDATGLIIGAQGTVEDISDQKQAEEALTDSEMRYRTLAESAQDAIYRIAPDMRVMYVNSFAARLLGTEQEDIVGKPLDSLFPSKTMEIMAPRLLSVFHTGKPSSVENKITFYKGVMWQNTSLVPIKDPNGKVASILGVSRDITDRKLAEDKLVTSLREKEVLLKEVHHRVKNNLQIIYSLLNIEANYTRDEGTKNVLSECQGRVKSMALIHESLYRSEDLARVNFASYIRNLTTALFRSYNVDKKIIRSDLDLEEIFLGIDQAISFGLILNELVTNCLKHAFPNGRAGEIKIELLSCNDLIMLIIKDNGIGLPANSTSSQGSGSLGLKLVDSLVKQLKGTIETNLSKGTEFKITFPMS
jgi:PAS domain S-box-containing protein